MKCNYCIHYKYNMMADPFFDDCECEFCNFEYDEDLPYRDDNWDILNLDDDLEWSHLQILYRLHIKEVPCLTADIWSDNNVAILTGCNAFPNKIAKALNIHEEVVYVWGDTTMVVINLYMEKCLRQKEKTG